MMIPHHHKEVGMSTRLDTIKKQLEELEERKALWRKQCQDEERRMALEFERELAEMDEKFSKAMEKIELEYTVKKEALMCKYSGKGVRVQSTTVRSDSCNDKTQLQFACSNPIKTTSQPHFVAPRTQQTKPLSVGCDDNKGIPRTVPFVSTTTTATNRSNKNQTAHSVRLSTDATEIEAKQSTVNMVQSESAVKKAPVVVSVGRNAVSRCVVFDPGGAAFHITVHSGTERCY